ncbi:MobA/MobL family protein [Roseivivax marinus]|nr:MobA/MobL family protein [Roseivivax marinus]
MTDHRTGLVHNYSRLPGLLDEDLVNWEGTAEQLWNAAEASETRINARVGRELRPALPVELPLDEQRRLVHGFCCWLKDQHQIAAHWVIHAPNFHAPDTGKQLWKASNTDAGKEAYKKALLDPSLTNLNFHAHIRWTVRRVDKETGTFGEKTREFDRTNPRELSAEERRDGLEPEEKIVGRDVVKNIRSEWEKRTNAALKRIGSSARIDLRSYEAMAAAGDAPDGMEAQEHLGPRNSAKARAAEHPVDPVMPMAAVRNAEKKLRNERRWKSWLELRNLEREKSRLENEGARIAADRERDRKERARKEKVKVAAATTLAEAEVALVEAQSVDIPLAGISFEEIIEWAQSGSPTPADHEEFDSGIDPETYENPDTIEAPREELRVVRKSKGMVRGRTG